MRTSRIAGGGRRLGAVTGMMIIAAMLIAPGARAGATEAGAPKAGTDTGGYPYAHAVNCSKKYGPQSWCVKGKDISPLGYKYRNDTDYVAWMFKRVFRIKLPGKLGSAGDWAARLKADGYTLSHQPRVGDIAIWPSSKKDQGHVAYVFAVSRGASWLDEYDANGAGTFTDSRTSRQIGNGSGPRENPRKAPWPRLNARRRHAAQRLGRWGSEDMGYRKWAAGGRARKRSGKVAAAEF